MSSEDMDLLSEKVTSFEKKLLKVDAKVDASIEEKLNDRLNNKEKEVPKTVVKVLLHGFNFSKSERLFPIYNHKKSPLFDYDKLANYVTKNVLKVTTESTTNFNASTRDEFIQEFEKYVNIDVQAAHNVITAEANYVDKKSESKKKTSLCSQSRYQVTRFNLNLPHKNSKELNNLLDKDVKKELKKINSTETARSFIKKYGQFYIRKANIGGSVIQKKTSESSYFSKFRNTSKSGKVKMPVKVGAVSAGKGESETKLETRTRDTTNEDVVVLGGSIETYCTEGQEAWVKTIDKDDQDIIQCDFGSLSELAKDPIVSEHLKVATTKEHLFIENTQDYFIHNHRHEEAYVSAFKDPNKKTRSYKRSYKHRPKTISNKLEDKLDATRDSLNIVGDDEKLGTRIVVSFLCHDTKDYFGVSKWRNKFLFRSFLNFSVKISNKTTRLAPENKWVLEKYEPGVTSSMSKKSDYANCYYIIPYGDKSKCLGVERNKIKKSKKQEKGSRKQEQETYHYIFRDMKYVGESHSTNNFIWHFDYPQSVRTTEENAYVDFIKLSASDKGDGFYSEEGFLTFDIQAEANACIAMGEMGGEMGEDEDNKNNRYEIVLGGSRNQKSWICKQDDKNVNVNIMYLPKMETPNILNGNELKSFRIEWKKNKFTVFERDKTAEEEKSANEKKIEWKTLFDLNENRYRMQTMMVNTIGCEGKWIINEHENTIPVRCDIKKTFSGFKGYKAEQKVFTQDTESHGEIFKFPEKSDRGKINDEKYDYSVEFSHETQLDIDKAEADHNPETEPETHEAEYDHNEFSASVLIGEKSENKRYEILLYGYNGRNRIVIRDGENNILNDETYEQSFDKINLLFNISWDNDDTNNTSMKVNYIKDDACKVVTEIKGINIKYKMEVIRAYTVGCEGMWKITRKRKDIEEDVIVVSRPDEIDVPSTDEPEDYVKDTYCSIASRNIRGL